jgi:hypothetical protein
MVPEADNCKVPPSQTGPEFPIAVITGETHCAIVLFLLLKAASSKKNIFVE